MKRFKIKWISGLALAALAAFVIMPGTSYAATSSTLSLSGPIIQGQGNFGVSGTCNTAGTVTYSITNPNGTTTLVGNSNATATTANANGSFNFNAGAFTVPSTYPSGAVTLTATCPNGDTVTTTASVLDPSTVLVGVNNGDPTVDGTVSVSGVCGNTGANGTVNFALSANGAAATSLAAGSNSVSTGANGSFNTTVTIPASANFGLGTLTATCNNGTTLSNLIVLGQASLAPVVVTPVDPGAVGGVSVVPTGGVAAGQVSSAQILWAVLAVVLIAGAASLIARRRLS